MNFIAEESESASAGSLTNKSTQRILQVLSCVAAEPAERFGVTDVSRRLNMTKNMAFRALNTLVEEGLLIRDASGSRYELGFGACRLRQSLDSVFDLRRICQPYMERIHVITGETVTLSVRSGHSSMVIEGIEGRNPVFTRVLYGRAIPLHAGPGSRAILAFMSDQEIEAYLGANSPLVVITPTTLAGPDALWANVREVRRVGYAIGLRDHVSTGNAIAFPILDMEGRSLGAIAIGAPEDQFPMSKLYACVPPIQAVMAELNVQTALLHADFGVPYPVGR